MSWFTDANLKTGVFSGESDSLTVMKWGSSGASSESGRIFACITGDPPITLDISSKRMCWSFSDGIVPGIVNSQNRSAWKTPLWIKKVSWDLSNDEGITKGPSHSEWRDDWLSTSPKVRKCCEIKDRRTFWEIRRSSGK